MQRLDYLTNCYWLRTNNGIDVEFGACVSHIHGEVMIIFSDSGTSRFICILAERCCQLFKALFLVLTWESNLMVALMSCTNLSMDTDRMGLGNWIPTPPIFFLSHLLAQFLRMKRARNFGLSYLSYSWAWVYANNLSKWTMYLTAWALTTNSLRCLLLLGP